MAITRPEKEKILKNLETGLRTAKIIIFVNFHGLNVTASHKLRKLLREIGVKYLVVKKTLVRKALEAVKFGGEMPKMEGELALAYSENDPLASAKAIEDFAKKNKTIKLIGGVFENGYLNAEKIIALANIPSREILLGKLVYVINSPIQRLVVALSRIKK